MPARSTKLDLRKTDDRGTSGADHSILRIRPPTYLLGWLWEAFDVDAAMRLRRCFASDPAPSSPAARRWRAALRCGARVTHPVSDGPQAARSGRLFGHVGTSRPTSRSPGRRPYESQTRRFIKARNRITGVPGHRNVIRAVAPCVSRPSARFRLSPRLRERFLDRRIPGAGRCDGRQSPPPQRPGPSLGWRRVSRPSYQKGVG